MNRCIAKHFLWYLLIFFPGTTHLQDQTYDFIKDRLNNTFSQNPTTLFVASENILWTSPGLNTCLKNSDVILESKYDNCFFSGHGRMHEPITWNNGFQFNNAGDENQPQSSSGFSLHLPFERFSPLINYNFMSRLSELSTLNLFAFRLNI
jgi:hypothetical protein